MTRFALLILLAVGVASAERGIFPHFAAGDGWSSSTVLSNSADTPQVVELTAYYDGYNPSLAQPVTFTIPAHGTYELVSEPTTTLEAGFLVITTNTLQYIDGTTIYRFSRSGLPDEEVAVPMARAPSKDIVLLFDDTQGFSNGVAIANGSTSNSVNAIVIARDRFGSTLATDNLQMAPLTHFSFLLADRYPALAGNRGGIEVQVAIDPATGAYGEPIILGIRASPSGSFTAILPTLVDVLPCTVSQ